MCIFFFFIVLHIHCNVFIPCAYEFCYPTENCVKHKAKSFFVFFRLHCNWKIQYFEQDVFEKKYGLTIDRYSFTSTLMTYLFRSSKLEPENLDSKERGTKSYFIRF